MNNKKDRYFSILDQGNMFQDSGHRTRFKELLDCYADFPFFTKGLCKCMYLAEYYVYQLSNAFLDNASYHLPEGAEIPPEIRHIISCALQAAELIDQV